MKCTNGLIWGLWSADPSWVCNSNGCGLQDSGSGWKQGNVFLFMLSGHCTCHREGVNPRATNLHQPAQSLFPSFQLSPQKIWLFLRLLPTFFWHKGSKAITLFVWEQWGKTNRRACGACYKLGKKGQMNMELFICKRQKINFLYNISLRTKNILSN